MRNVGRTCTVSAAHTRCWQHTHGVSSTRTVSATHAVLAAHAWYWPHYPIASLPRGAWCTLWGWGYPPFMKNFYGLELHKNHFCTKKWVFAPTDLPPRKLEKSLFFGSFPIKIASVIMPIKPNKNKLFHQHHLFDFVALDFTKFQGFWILNDYNSSIKSILPQILTYFDQKRRKTPQQISNPPPPWMRFCLIHTVILFLITGLKKTKVDNM